MSILSDNSRIAVWADLMRDWSRDNLPCSITKADLRAAVNAIDQWVDDNAATVNSAIPQPARSALTQSQKAQLFALIVLKRYEDGS